MNHLFSIGEKVILQSKQLPEHNGCYVIEGIIEVNEDFVCRLTGQTIYPNEGYVYILDTPLVDFIECDGVEALWLEESLKKFQDPSEFNFNELMADLKRNITEPITAIS